MPRACFVASCEETRALDVATERELALPPGALMEIAGTGCFLLLRAMLEPKVRILAVCGPGQNGGDGFVVARLAACAGLATAAFAMKIPSGATPSHLHFERLAACGVCCSVANLSALDDALRDPDAIVVDALFGTGLDQPLRHDAARWIESVNRARGTKVSIDLPSGLDGDSGTAPGGCVSATRTFTIGALKPGLLTPGGAAKAGAIEVVPLPYPQHLTRHLRTVELPR